MPNLDTQTGKINLILRNYKDLDDPCFDENKLIEYLNTYYLRWFMIKHDKDTDDQGIVIHEHYHIIGDLKKCYQRQRLSKTLSDLCTYMTFFDNIGIQIEKYNSLNGSVRYLLHLDNPNKYQYDRINIKSNVNFYDLDFYLDNNDFSFDYDNVIQDIAEGMDMLDLYRKYFGYIKNNYTNYRIIKDMYDLVHQQKYNVRNVK